MTLDGQIKYYVCKKSTCSMRLKVLFSSNEFKNLYYRSVTGHEHENLEAVPLRGIHPETKKIIKELFGSGITKPLQILFNIKSRHPAAQEPSLMSIRNYLPKIKAEIYGPKINSLNLLEMWAEKYSNRPSDNLTPFVLHKSFNYDTERFVILITTHQLLSNTNSKLFQIDSTYKLVWQGYPVLVMGTSDISRVNDTFIFFI